MIFPRLLMEMSIHTVPILTHFVSEYRSFQDCGAMAVLYLYLYLY